MVRLLKLTALLLFAIVLVAFGASGVRVYGAWYQFSPQGSVDGQGILRDVESRCDAQGRRNAYEPDRVTYCHELTHQLNSRIRCQNGGTGKVNAFYCGQGRSCLLSEPRCKITDILALLPRDKQSTAYSDSMQLREWNSQPLYVLDEFSAYANGVQCGKELRCDLHGEDNFAMAGCGYGDALIEAVKQRDPGYRELSGLTEFVAWQKARVIALVGGSRTPAVRQISSQIAIKPQAQAAAGSVLIDLPSKYRAHNDNHLACVRCSVVNMLRVNGCWEHADQFWKRYGNIPRGEAPESLKPKLDAFGIKYQMTTQGNKAFILNWIRRGYAVGVALNRKHMVNAVGGDEQHIVLMGNQVLDRLQTRTWPDFLQEFDGWSVVILSGKPPKGEPAKGERK